MMATEKKNVEKSRFAFGENWKTFVGKLDESHILQARRAMLEFEGVEDFSGMSVLDIGCGSGVHSLVMHRGNAAHLLSIDYDPASVDCCQQIKQQYAAQATNWQIQRGDILSMKDVQSWGLHDLVYAWGVLHHTGDMWTAIDHALKTVKPSGRFHLAIYNDHWTSKMWHAIKHFYCASPGFIKEVMIRLYASYEFSKWMIKGKNPWAEIRAYQRDRGMTWFVNLRDWLGGYPYQYASVDAISSFVTKRGFTRERCFPNEGTGCSEFLFRRLEAP